VAADGAARDEPVMRRPQFSLRSWFVPTGAIAVWAAVSADVARDEGHATTQPPERDSLLNVGQHRDAVFGVGAAFVGDTEDRA